MFDNNAFDNVMSDNNVFQRVSSQPSCLQERISFMKVSANLFDKSVSHCVTLCHIMSQFRLANMSCEGVL